MLNIVFNELSLNEKTSSVAHSQAKFENFLQLADKINSLKIAPVRIRMSVDLPNLSLGDDYFTIKDWIKTIDSERRQRYLAFFVQSPIIADNPYFFYEDQEVNGFGYAVNNSLGSISLPTNDVWVGQSYVLRSEYLPDGESDVIVEKVEVKHLIEINSQINHRDWLKEEFEIKRSSATKEVEDFPGFWEKLEILFPSLLFCPIILEHINKFDSVNNPSFKKVLSYLVRLENHMSEVKRGNRNHDDLPGNVSNDSEATLKKYKEERIFTGPEGEPLLFSLHCKLGDVRIYLKTSEDNITIGYIGSHLKTVKFS